jgi:uncharacterized protein (TIGR02646 family)
MRFLKKSRVPPKKFTKLINKVICTDGNNGYESLAGESKADVIEILVNEQNGLCVYCNQKISTKSATIEHFLCQSHNPMLDLNYHNLYAVCKGNDGQKNASHCDKYRANVAGNDYFLPFFMFDNCLTINWDQINPFFDIEFNRKLGLVSGKIIARESNIKAYPPIKQRIEYTIKTLNLNTQILIDARKFKWEEVLRTRNDFSYSWEDLFRYYLEMHSYTDFYEFVLLAIRKQI